MFAKDHETLVRTRTYIIPTYATRPVETSIERDLVSKVIVTMEI